MKRRFLVVYDYGTGGQWWYINALSAEQIRKKFPELDVLEKEPEWFTEEIRALIKDDVYDIDAEPRGMLLALVHNKHNKGRRD